MFQLGFLFVSLHGGCVCHLVLCSDEAKLVKHVFQALAAFRLNKLLRQVVCFLQDHRGICNVSVTSICKGT